MDRKEILKKVGSMQQLAYVREIEYKNGRSSGLKVYDVKNDKLSFQCMIDKCLDINQLSYKGINFNFLSKPGLQGRNHYDTNGDEALRSIMGGMFFTAGFENICPPFAKDGKNYPMHGRIRTTPCENLTAESYFEGDDYKIKISGEAREAELFGENLVLRRTIETVYGDKKIIMTDEVENQSFRVEPFMVLYHINFGYPLLDEGTEIIIPAKSSKGREEHSQNHIDKYNVMDEAIDNELEYCFSHEPVVDSDGRVRVAVINNNIKLGMMISYDYKNLPYLLQWKSVASGDYVIAIEPANGYFGREYEEKNNSLHSLKPFEKEKIVIEFEILDGQAEIDKIKNEILNKIK